MKNIIKKPIYPTIGEKFADILYILKFKGYISDKELQHLNPRSDCRLRNFYTLPKVHRAPGEWLGPSKDPAGLPIVSDIGSDLYRISEYVGHFPALLAKKHNSFIKDSYDFKEKFKTVEIKPEYLLVTLYVERMYTNINNIEGIHAVEEAFEGSPDLLRPDKEVLELLRLCLENNDFTFNSQRHLQISGTAIGKIIAPNYANIFMADWEEKVP